MNFNKVLNNYLNRLNCKAKELADYSNISSSVISRYRSGERIPKINSKQFNSLIDGIHMIANNRKIKLSKDEITNSLINSLGKIDYDFELIKINLNFLIDLLKINITELSRYLGYDPSYLSKIRSGVRTPTYPDTFINNICQYIVNNYNNENFKDSLSSLMEINKDNLYDNNSFLLNLKSWLCHNQKESINYMDNFLKKIDDFNLNEYISIIHYDELKVPTIPFNLPKSKFYYGLEEMKQGELDFFKATVLSKNKDNIFMCSDMQIDDMAKDIEFGKKWMFALAYSLKKGLHLNIIHNLDRPFNEMMIGLLSWIPIYMTGQISPYYFKNNQTKIYSHLTYVSGNYSLSGECLKGYHSNGKYYLTNNKKEVEYYQDKAKKLLNLAYPLMDIYQDKYDKNLLNFLNKDIDIMGERKRILSFLPLHTITDDLLTKLIKDKGTINRIKKVIEEEKSKIKSILKNNIYTDEVKILKEDNFFNNKITININDIELTYNYNIYLEHYKNTIDFEKRNKNYNLINNSNLVFKNIDIYINKNNYVIISKKKNPEIYFVIKHEKMIDAIEKFIPPVIE